MEDRLEFLLIVVGIKYVGLTNKAQEILRTYYYFFLIFLSTNMQT